jgi:hypothetical protein
MGGPEDEIVTPSVCVLESTNPQMWASAPDGEMITPRTGVRSVSNLLMMSSAISKDISVMYPSGDYFPDSFDQKETRSQFLQSRVRRFYTESASGTLALMRTKKKSPKRPALIIEQIEIVGQFNDYAHEHPGLSFDEVARKEFGPNVFPNTPNGRKFRSECKSVFDLERAS